MKKINRLPHFLMTLFLLTIIVSCSDDDNGGEMMPNSTVVDLALGSSDLTILVDALTRANLVNTLQGDGPYTVFAPTNDAFTTFLADNNFSSLEDVPTELLTDVLLNHVVSGNNVSSSLTTGYVSSLSTAGAEDRTLSLFINTEGGVSINGVSDVTEADLTASNGVVHVVDAVIDLPSIVDQAIANPDFSSLVGALTADGNTTFTDLLSSTDTDFTVFAPVDAAFTVFDNPNDNDLPNILSYHVIAGDAAFSDELMPMYATTAATNEDDDALSIYIRPDANGVEINGAVSVVTADVVTTNGVIHAVNQVIDLPTVVTFAAADPNFSTLVDALTILTPDTDFVSVLTAQNGNGDDPFTVFAPTNDAFTALGDLPDAEGLVPVLQHHVVAGANIRSSDLTDGISATTLEGDVITINLPGTGDNIADITDGSGNDDVGIIVVDVQAYNGVIHVVNKVLLPDTNN